MKNYKWEVEKTIKIRRDEYIRKGTYVHIISREKNSWLGKKLLRKENYSTVEAVKIRKSKTVQQYLLRKENNKAVKKLFLKKEKEQLLRNCFSERKKNSF